MYTQQITHRTMKDKIKTKYHQLLFNNEAPFNDKVEDTSKTYYASN